MKLDDFIASLVGTDEHNIYWKLCTAVRLNQYHIVKYICEVLPHSIEWTTRDYSHVISFVCSRRRLFGLLPTLLKIDKSYACLALHADICTQCLTVFSKIREHTLVCMLVDKVAAGIFCKKLGILLLRRPGFVAETYKHIIVKLSICNRVFMQKVLAGVYSLSYEQLRLISIYREYFTDIRELLILIKIRKHRYIDPKFDPDILTVFPMEFYTFVRGLILTPDVKFIHSLLTRLAHDEMFYLLSARSRRVLFKCYKDLFEVVTLEPSGISAEILAFGPPPTTESLVNSITSYINLTSGHYQIGIELCICENFITMLDRQFIIDRNVAKYMHKFKSNRMLLYIRRRCSYMLEN